MTLRNFGVDEASNQTGLFQSEPDSILNKFKAETEKANTNSLFISGLSQIGAEFADFASTLLQQQIVSGDLLSQAEQHEENARIARFNQKLVDINRKNTLNKAQKEGQIAVGANIVAAYASGVTVTGSAARSIENVNSQLNQFNFEVYNNAEIQIQEFEFQALRSEELARQAREAAEGSFWGDFLGIASVVLGVAAIVVTAGAAAPIAAAGITATSAATVAGVSAATAGAAGAAASAAVAASISATATALKVASTATKIASQFVR